jgi:hypothetical protein
MDTPPARNPLLLQTVLPHPTHYQLQTHQTLLLLLLLLLRVALHTETAHSCSCCPRRYQQSHQSLTLPLLLLLLLVARLLLLSLHLPPAGLVRWQGLHLGTHHGLQKGTLRAKCLTAANTPHAQPAASRSFANGSNVGTKDDKQAALCMLLLRT